MNAKQTINLCFMACLITLTGCKPYVRKSGNLMPGISENKKAYEQQQAGREQPEQVPPTTKNGSIAFEQLAKLQKSVPEQMLLRKAYAVSYNKENRIPNWVAWQLTGNHISGPYKRAGIQFHEDYEADGPKVNTFDYARSGYDRGHMCPSGDNKWDKKAQEESFLMTNMCPQSHNLNTGDWNTLENKCRDWAREYGAIYIVCGPILRGEKHRRIGKNRVTVPEAFFKVVLCMEETPKAIGFVYENEDGHRNTEHYSMPVDEVEKLTGIDFFPTLPDNIENKIEASANYHAW